MRQRRIGQTDLHASELGLGCAKLSGSVSKSVSSKEAIQLLHGAFDQGINFFDTADSYGGGKSEELLGEAFHDRRDQVIFASKAGYRVSAAAGWALRIKPLLKPLISSMGWMKRAVRQARSTQKPQDFSPEYLTQAIEGSLKRLQTDYLDLFQLHNPPLTVIEQDEVFDVLGRLKEQGKIRFYGISCRSIDEAAPSMRWADVSTIQIPVSLVEQRAIGDVFPQAEQRGVGIIARQPLASGFLARSAEDVEIDLTTIDEHQAEQQLAAARTYQFLSNGSRTLAEAALRFVLQQEEVAVTLVGTSNPHHLQSNLAVLNTSPLTEEEIAAVRKAA